MASATPPGWPSELPPPGTDEFLARATGWLFDRCPPEFRAHEVLRRHPRVLAWLALKVNAGMRDGLRQAYSDTRRELIDEQEPEVIEATLFAVGRQGALLNSTLREIELVWEALGGREWAERL